MQRNEITPELIELSKKAKELGFPQDVEEGDWIYCPPGNYEWEIRLVAGDGAVSIYRDILKNLPERGFFLILSFSRCLEWLHSKGWCLSLCDFDYTVGVKTDSPYHVVATHHDFPMVKTGAKTHHEAIAKVVVKRLEETCPKKSKS